MSDTIIPKKIHYCWFGGSPLPKLAEMCIASWRKYMPDYEIVRWDESNFDVNGCSYSAEAYAGRKYAFVSDWARFVILYNEGGIYFDTDVELIASIEDIVERGPFMACEESSAGVMVNPGLGLAARPAMPLFKKIIDYYTSQRFTDDRGETNLTSVVTRVTEILEDEGLRSEPLDWCRLGEIDIYAHDYFSPKSYETGRIEITPRTRSIHHFACSWFSEEKKLSLQLERKMLWLGKTWRGRIAGFEAYRRLHGWRSAFWWAASRAREILLRKDSKG